MNVAKTQTWKLCGVPHVYTKIPQIIVNFDSTFVKSCLEFSRIL